MKSRHISEHLQAVVRQRARESCEYCKFPQQLQEATFHIDHILPVSKGGKTSPENLALACVSCSLRKGAKDRWRDPVGKKFVKLFNPRIDLWDDHFEWRWDWRVRGKTFIGRATVDALKMNRVLALRIREELASLGLFP